MNPLEYLHLQLRLEGREVVNGDLLRQVEFVPGEDMPMLVIGLLVSGGQVVYYDESLAPEYHKHLREQMGSLDDPDVDPLAQSLRSWGFNVQLGRFRTYIFPADYKDQSTMEVTKFTHFDPKVQAFGFDGISEQVYAVERDGRIVSACVSARENTFCGEAWVYTDADQRGQGFARKVVSAWAGSLISAGKVPFYSHKVENTASAILAKRLGLQVVFEEIVIERAGKASQG